MAEKKTKIVLDNDVVNHFFKGGLLHMLPQIFPEFQYIILDVVKREIPIAILSSLIPMMSKEKCIKEEVFGASSGEKKEYLRLIATAAGLGLGKGESACMVYCRYHHDVIGSNNTKDIRSYCEQYGITYLTTNDFLFYAIRRGLLTKDEAAAFIQKIRSMGSYPEVVDFDTYICTKI